jgi:arginine-tRNA-protein transferase
MFAVKHYPRDLNGAELDLYLSRGWYRMGQTIFTTHFLCFDNTFYSALWIRQDLEGYHFRKSLRKILRKNDAAYRWTFGKARINKTREDLYTLYKADFDGLLAPSLSESLQDGEHHNIYNTYEFCAYDGNQLVALSYFDLGKESAASIIGIYHPAYKNQSMGFYTMLKEMEFCQKAGLKYYYPGYVVPGYARFDYKSRIGSVDYYDLYTNNWLPLEELPAAEIPINQIENNLLQLQQDFAKRGITAQLKYYPLFEANLFGYWRLPYFDYPAFLLCKEDKLQNTYEVIVYDPRTHLFQLLRCAGIEEFQFYFNDHFARNFQEDQYFIELISIEQVLASTKDAKGIVEAFHQVKSSQKS